ncbi:MAG: GrpB family protein [Candidatus Heimdallarchaeota archaeon]|nr:GrpB family protein [Candidatus Heimdallarchaeota archaeon]
MINSVEISNYDPNWPKEFEEEKQRLLSLIGSHVIGIEHVGSTAVPGLGAKPIIDILIGLKDLNDAKSCIPLLERLNYEYVPEYEDELPERRYFRKPPRGQGRRKFHIHMVATSSDFWERQLLFRDYLRLHPEVAKEYYILKKELVAKFTNNRRMYTDNKTVFITKVLEKAREELE